MIRTVLLLVPLLLTHVDGARAQTAAYERTASDPGPAALARVDSLYAAFDVTGSLEGAEALVAAGADSAGAAAWRAARAAIALGMLAEGDDAQNTWYRRGEGHAERALAADSLSMDALFWLAAAKGRFALQASAGDAARLGDEVWRLAHRMLARDPDHAGAHNVLGKLQDEVMRLSRVERFFAKVVLGDNEALRSSSWEGAEREHRRAVALVPDGVLYRYDLARTLLRRDRREEAVVELRTVLTLPARYPPDVGVKEDARRLLGRLGAQP